MAALRSWIAIAALLAGAAHAADDLPPANDRWSLATGETVSPEHDVFTLEAGWPGVSLGVLHGVTDRADAGLRLQLLYGFEDITGRRLGFGLGVPLRLVAFREGAVSLQLHIEPGLRGYWTGGREGANDTFYVLRAPVGATLGLQATSGLRLAASLELQASLLHQASPTRACSCGWNFLVGPQLGSAIEYTAGPDILVGLDVRAGLEGETTRGTTRLALSAQLVIGYRPSAGSEEQPGFFWPERNRSLLLVGSGAVLGAAGGLGLLYSYKEARDYLAGQSSGTQTVTRAEARAVQIIQPASWAAVGLGAVLLGWGVYRLETAAVPVASVSPVPGGALVSLGGAFQ